MHYFLIAGEASGDLHASELMSSLKAADTEAEFTFLGGDLMAAVAQRDPVIHYRDMAFMGFSEVIRHLGQIRRNFKTARRAIAAAKPDCLVLIDYPSFNLKMAEYASKLGIPVYYYISPKVWAWKEWRVKTIKRLVRKMFVIFPFEVDFYRGHDYQVDFVGNPSVEEVTRKLSAAPSRAEFLSNNRLRDRKIVALLPGSRLSEIRNNLPIMVQALDRFPQYRGVVAGAPGVDADFYKQITDLPVLHGQTFDLLAHAHAALVTSGTATLETAIARVPQVVLYRSNGSKITYNLMKKLLKVQHVSLPNLIAGRTIIPEMLLHLCTADTVADELTAILPDSEARRRMIDDYDQMLTILGPNMAAPTAASLLISDLKAN